MVKNSASVRFSVFWTAEDICCLLVLLNSSVERMVSRFARQIIRRKCADGLLSLIAKRSLKE